VSLERSLLLNRYLHRQFGAERFEPIKKALQPCQEGVADDGHSHFYHTLAGRTGLVVSAERLAAYDERVLRYEADLRRNRRTDIFRSFKYFQYIAVLYTEILLDRLTEDPAGLLAPEETPTAKIPGAEKLTWDDLERDYPILRQSGDYVAKLMALATEAR
jgi:hypothetical protein